ncbi:DUF1566 domain-containing protein [bacterium]|nr:DUF1566 domain-containing protein [bacterium]
MLIFIGVVVGGIVIVAIIAAIVDDIKTKIDMAEDAAHYDALKKIWKEEEDEFMIEHSGYIELLRPIGSIRMIASGFCKEQSWDSAMFEAKMLTIGGFKDWRLPTIEEYKMLYESKPLWPSHYNCVPGKEVFWSSSKQDDDEVWVMDFDDGQASTKRYKMYEDMEYYSYYVR